MWYMSLELKYAQYSRFVQMRNIHTYRIYHSSYMQYQVGQPYITGE